MSEIAEILTASAAVIVAVGTLWNTIKIHQVQKSTNGLKQELEDIARKEGKAEGVAQEKASHNGK